MGDLIREAERVVAGTRGGHRRGNALRVLRRSASGSEREKRSGERSRCRPVPGSASRGFRSGCGVLALLLAGLSAESRADLLAGWNFNSIDATAPMLSANVGFGEIDPAASADAMEFFSGTTMNGLPEWPAGESLGFRGADAEGGSFIVNAWPAPGLGLPADQLTASFAAKRSATGCDLVRIDQWRDGEWSEAGFATIGTEWETHHFGLPRVEPFIDAIAFRITMTGSTGSQGTLRFDNLMLHGTSVPAPGSLALLALGGVMSARRRRPGSRRLR